VALSTAAFGLLHLGAGWQKVLLVLAPGLALALLYQRSRDWRLCVALHAGMNALALGHCFL
jgi:membrane protease YdiL (CAAX protease family)